MPMTPPEEAYGRRTFVDIVQKRAKQGHHIPYALIANTADPADGFHELSYADLNRAGEACAWLVDEAMKDTDDFSTFAWMGPASDIRYFAMLLAAMKTRRKVFLPSHRNSLAAHLSLSEQCSCSHFFVPDTAPPTIVQAIAEKRPLKIVSVPSLDALVRSDPSSYDLNAAYEDCWLDPVCVLHTSGSTGFPKVVTVKHNFWSSVDALNRLPNMGMRPSPLATLKQSRNFVPLPLFHCAGLVCGTAYTVYFDHTLISTPDMPLTADAVNQVLEHIAPTYAVLPAAVIKDLVDETAFHENIRTVKYFSWAGAPIAPEVGTKLFKLTSSFNVFGMTEASALPTEALSAEDYRYFRFSPVLGAEFRLVSPDEYELVMVRNPEYELFQTIFGTYPQLQEWGTKDLFTPHPSKPGLWAYRGRLDDIITFSNGEKLNPSSIEGAVTSHLEVMGALVTGVGRFQAGLLVELKEPAETLERRDQMLEVLWPIVQRANEDTVAHGRIAKDMIMFTKQDKPLIRSPKGSIQRRVSMDLYEQEVEALYKSDPRPANADSDTSFDLKKPDKVCQALKILFAAELGRDPILLADSDDLFTLGLDSLQATNIARELSQQVHIPKVTARLIYKHPTPRGLSSFLCKGTDADTESVDKPSTVKSLFEGLCADLPITTRPSVPGSNSVVMLIGSTGSLGPYLLHFLLQNVEVSTIFCCNRKPRADRRQKQQHKERNLGQDFSRVRFVHADTESNRFGLNAHLYRELLSSVTHVVHNAWPVNFNMSVESFQSPLRGLRRVIEFALHSTHGASIHFMSSVSTVMNYRSISTACGETVPEKLQNEWDVSDPTGYGRSKLIGERLLAEAAQVSGVSAAIYRIGQISGPVKFDGVWPKQEWLPSLIASSKLLGVLPDTLGPVNTIDWIPVDTLASIIVDLVDGHSNDQDGPAVHHLANPQVTVWDQLAPVVLKHFQKSSHMTQVSLAEWVGTLQESAMESQGSAEELSKNPAVKLLTFFDDLAQSNTSSARLSTVRTCARSATLESLGPVSTGWMEQWLQQWAY